MAIGSQASVASINNTLTTYAVGLRGLCQNIANFQVFVVTLGSAGLQAIGFSSPDATALLNMASTLNTMAGLFNGTATQATQYNFNNALSSVYAGQ